MRRHFCKVRAPGSKKGKRVEQTLSLVPIHEALDQEYRANQNSRQEDVEALLEDASEWGSFYEQHPLVVSRAPADPPIIPFAIYLDGIRYSKQIGARAQSILLITAYNLLTNKRHVIAILRIKTM